MLQLLRFENLNTQTESTDEGLSYLKTLFKRCNKGYIEIRPLSSSKGRQWIPVNKIIAPTIPDKKDICVGVATRKEGKGAKKDIIEIPAVWMDLDFKDIKEEKANKKLDDFKLKPSMTVRSGNGLHLYWILEKPATNKDIKRIEDINKRLAAHLNGDAKATDASHILRLPGTNNCKYTPSRSVILDTINDNLYKLSDFNFLLPVKSNVMPDPSTNQNSDLTFTLLNGVLEGERHSKVVSLAARYEKLHLPIKETKEILFQWNQNNTPPLSIEELNKTIDDVYKRYSNNDLITISGYTDYCSVIEQSVIGELDFMIKKFPTRPSIISPWLKSGEIGMISAAKGVGKTWLGLLIAMMATRTMEIGRWKTETPTGCLYIDGEMPGGDMQQRILELEKSYHSKKKIPIQFLSGDDMRYRNLRAPNLANADCRNGILNYLKKQEDIRLLILDNISCLTPGLDENARKDWDVVSQWLLQLRSMGKAVILMHHQGKNNTQRGTSAREDLLNVSIKLKRPEGYQSEEGARFIVEFTKNRRFYGKDAKSFELKLQTKNMKLTWVVDEDETKKKNAIIEMLNDGDRQKDIAKELYVSASYVTQVKKKAKEKGKLGKKRQLPDLEEDIKEKKDQEIN